MEHILISPGKLKLMLTKSDLDKYELNCDNIDSEDAQTRKAFRELLDDVGKVSGFDAAEGKLFVQLYPSKDGGAEIYITRLTPKGNAGASEDAAVRRTCVYRFDTMGALLDTCARANAHSSAKASGAWHGDNAYYLITEDSITYREYLRGSTPHPLKEYVTGGCLLAASALTAAFVREHCECFCDRDAIAKLASLK